MEVENIGVLPLNSQNTDKDGKFTAMDQLIDLVQMRESIWNMKCSNYGNRQLKRKCWKEISEILGWEPKLLQAKWKNLRSHFLRELRKLKAKNKGSGQTFYNSNWRYFYRMMFSIDYDQLNEPVKPLPTEKCVREQHNDKETESSQDITEESVEFLDSNLLVRDSQLTPITNNKIIEKDANNENISSKVLEEFSQKTKSEDDDYHFAMSIIPSMESLPHHRKLYIRTKIQEYLYNEHINLQKRSTVAKFTY